LGGVAMVSTADSQAQNLLLAMRESGIPHYEMVHMLNEMWQSGNPEKHLNAFERTLRLYRAYGVAGDTPLYNPEPNDNQTNVLNHFYDIFPSERRYEANKSHLQHYAVKNISPISKEKTTLHVSDTFLTQLEKLLAHCTTSEDVHAILYPPFLLGEMNKGNHGIPYMHLSEPATALVTALQQSSLPPEMLSKIVTDWQTHTLEASQLKNMETSSSGMFSWFTSLFASAPSPEASQYNITHLQDAIAQAERTYIPPKQQPDTWLQDKAGELLTNVLNYKTPHTTISPDNTTTTNIPVYPQTSPHR
ncbi:MAG: hypothetical protein KDD76_05210, partial [Rickettsiales bacterium]|nr:hypothetical protein [Rickettsiales bacterium]